MKVLVTGATGFVGKHVVRLLQQRNHEVLASSRTPSLEYVQFSLDSEESISSFLEKNEVECIVHLSGRASVAQSFSEPFITHHSNVCATVNLLKVLYERYRNIRLILASTSEIYKPIGDLKLSEDCVLEPVSPYGLSKLYIDSLARMLAEKEKLSWVVVRPFNTIGPGQNMNYVFPSFVRQVVEMKRGTQQKKMRVGNIQVSRDFTDIRDIALGYVLLCENETKNEVYNLCSGNSYRLQDCLSEMFSIAGITELDVEVDESLLRPREVMNFVGSSEKIYKNHGWQARIPIDQTIYDLMKDIENRL